MEQLEDIMDKLGKQKIDEIVKKITSDHARIDHSNLMKLLKTLKIRVTLLAL